MSNGGEAVIWMVVFHQPRNAKLRAGDVKRHMGLFMSINVGLPAKQAC